VRAAVLHEHGAAPRCGEFPDPEPGPGEVVVEVEAAALHHLDLLKASGTFYVGPPPLPSARAPSHREPAAQAGVPERGGDRRVQRLGDVDQRVRGHQAALGHRPVRRDRDVEEHLAGARAPDTVGAHT
jgi:threonine dehydrogenase-like Zn-dependent dehydrogenase